jgi:hypothetical protein
MLSSKNTWVDQKSRSQLIVEGRRVSLACELGWNSAFDPHH